MQAVHNNIEVVAKYNVHHRAGHQLHQLNIVSDNVGYSESLLADYTGALCYLLRKAYSFSVRKYNDTLK